MHSVELKQKFSEVSLSKFPRSVNRIMTATLSYFYAPLLSFLLPEEHGNKSLPLKSLKSIGNRSCSSTMVTKKPR